MMKSSNRRLAATLFISLSLLITDVCAEIGGALVPIITHILDAENSKDITIVKGPLRVVEAEVSNVAKHYNNSVSSPLARHGDYAYWIYVAADDPEAPSEYFMQLHQIRLPESRVDGPYPRVDYDFVNNYGQADHELRVRDGSDTPGSNDPTHTAPSVGVDQDGYIHVLGGMHHSPWDYCISAAPNDISNFNCLSQDSEHLPPHTRITYPRFFKHKNGRLFLSYRAQISTDWHHGTTLGALALYDESSKTWSSVGSDDYVVGDLYIQDNPTANLDPTTGQFLLPLAKGGFGYQAYWQDIKIDHNGRIHAAVVLVNTPSYSPNSDGANPNRMITVNENGGGRSYSYDEKSYIMNYTQGASVLYAYSDNMGQTFHAPNGQQLTMPVSPEPLETPDGQNNRVSATLSNGAIVFQNDSQYLNTNLWLDLDIILSSEGEPIIQFRERVSNASGFSMKNIKWNGRAWAQIPSASTRLSGIPGGVINDGTGSLWAFEPYNSGPSQNPAIPASPTSAGNRVIYSSNGEDGPWQEIESLWLNGLRFDTFTAGTSNVIRYVEMDIQRSGVARIISLIPPKDVVTSP